MVCPICGTSLLYSSASDEKRHRRFHNEFVNGIKFKPLPSDSVLAERNEFRTIIIGPYAPRPQRVRAEKVARMVNNEVHYDFISYHADEFNHRNQRHALLVLHSQRAVALAVVGKCPATEKAISWNNMNTSQAPQLTSPLRWTVNFVWVLSKYRQLGVASQLLTDVAKWAGIAVKDFAWTLPFSKVGKAVALHFCPTEIFIDRTGYW